jgi:hypothetical protein
VVISPYDDDVAEPVESVTLAVANFNNTYNIGSVFQGTVNITDNGDTPLINVRSGNVGTEGGTNPTFVFRSIGNGTGNITVNYTVSGTATAGSDYTALSGSVSVPANGSNDTTVTIPLSNDTLPEATETVVVTITPSASYRAYNDASAEMVIQDNDSGADRVSVSTYNHSPQRGHSHERHLLLLTHAHSGRSHRELCHLRHGHQWQRLRDTQRQRGHSRYSIGRQFGDDAHQ